MENMEQIKVSVIVPVYNVEKYLAKCLESLAAQTLPEIEILVVNDGSPDGSQAIIEEFAARYPERIIALSKENGGLGDARNFGIAHARGAFIGFVDSDDWVDPKMFEAMYNFAVRENHQVVLCDMISINDGWHHGEVSRGYRGENNPPDHYDFMLNCMNPAVACNKLFDRNLFHIIQFPKLWYEDMGTTPVLLSYAGSIGYLNIPFYYYRQREGSIISSNRNPKTLEVIDAWKRAIEHCKKDYQAEVIEAVYESIITFMGFKPEYCDSFLGYFRENMELFLKNAYVEKKIKARQLEDLSKKQLIPKKIHYFWFGGNPKSELIESCIASWRKYAPDYEIIEWNEENCDINECDYVREAYEHKKWAFVADYFRIKKIYEFGGIYVDTDMEFTNAIDSLRLNAVFFEFESRTAVNACIFGSVAWHPTLARWLETYQKDHLVRPDGSLNTSYTIVSRLTKILLKDYQLTINGNYQRLPADIVIYPPNVLIVDVFDGRNLTVHHYDASWWDVKVGLTSYKHEVLKDYFSNGQALADSGEAELLRAYIFQIENSTCWKITKPLRIFIDFVKRLLHKAN
ncbi:glycosyltransferase [Anaerotruncus colihominis]|uniref:Glycosyltransferase n=2 Tax=Anaerotruncus colihominis TaxID=169435 RepID=A0A845RKI5_9FIRM|nr:glycosyltransferase [Anaerotruncus colihominis]NBI80117.1 glycosyltransferase [Anaerotruncus colihominis]